MEISVYIATSLDGFIARENGEIDWLTSDDYVIDGEDYGFSDFFSTVTCLVMGRNTFEKVLSFPEWPYEGMRVIVMSRTSIEIPKSLINKIEVSSDSPEVLVAKLKNDNEQKLYIDGGRIIQSFLNAGIIDNLIISTIPVLIGSGLPLFSKLSKDVKVKHVETKSFKSGLVQTKYECKTT